MTRQKLSILCVLSLLAAISLPAAAQSDNHAPAYDSAAQPGNLPAYTRGSPESEGRPGQYYFGVGANAFTHKEYSFAVNMYQVAASWAYKPAEFNLGVMYARGQGIPVDLPRAMAWMTLAAERGEPAYVKARELVRSNLTTDQLAESKVILQQLTPIYGDKVALRRAKDRWAQVRSSMTGSRVGSVAGNMVMGAPKAGAATTDPKFSTGEVVPVQGAAVMDGKSMDGSMGYQQLVASDNPYDPKFRVMKGSTSVGPLTSVKKTDAETAAKRAAKSDDTGTPSQPR